VRPLERRLLYRRLLVSALVTSLLAIVLALHRPGLVTRLDDDLYDSMTRTVRREPPTGRVVIVDIDDRSLAEQGQWPWSRDKVGRLIERIRARGASTVALDIVFSERDREVETPAGTAPQSSDRQPGQFTATDLALAETLRQGRVVLGYAMTFDDAPDRRGCVLHPLRAAVVEAGRAQTSRLYRASGAVCNLPVLAEAAGSSGFLNAAPDSDGILRRVPLVIALDNRLYPALSLAAVVAMTGTDQIHLRIAEAQTTWLALGERSAPLDGNGNLLVRYLGKERTFPYVSAADVLANRGSIDLTNALVFVGATALGTQEDVATPVQPLFPGVEVQATVAESLLLGQFVSRPAYATFAEALLVMLGVSVVWVVSRAGVVWGACVFAGLSALLWIVAYRLFAQGLFVSPVLPTVSLVVAYAAIVALRLRDERAHAFARADEAMRTAAAAESVKDEVLRKASHELRTPLTVIAGWAHLLGIGGLTDRQKKTALATIRQNVQAQTRLIEHLVDASALADGDIRLEMRTVDLGDAIRSVIARYERLLQEKRIRFRVTVGSGCVVSGEPERLRQIVDALLSNAAKFTPEDGNVELRVVRSGDHVEILVADDGVGINPAFQPQLFERFRQQDDMTRQPHGGLGLGLAIVQKLVRLHGGAVTVDSKGDGQGATFTVWLPAVATDDERIGGA
jgi:signal transduction histidine kinase